MNRSFNFFGFISLSGRGAVILWYRVLRSETTRHKHATTRRLKQPCHNQCSCGDNSSKCVDDFDVIDDDDDD